MNNNSISDQFTQLTLESINQEGVKQNSEVQVVPCVEIPKEIYLHIFTYLSNDQLRQVASTCKEWKMLIDYILSKRMNSIYEKTLSFLFVHTKSEMSFSNYYLETFQNVHANAITCHYVKENLSSEKDSGAYALYYDAENDQLLTLHGPNSKHLHELKCWNPHTNETLYTLPFKCLASQTPTAITQSSTHITIAFSNKVVVYEKAQPAVNKSLFALNAKHVVYQENQLNVVTSSPKHNFLYINTYNDQLEEKRYLQITDQVVQALSSINNTEAEDLKIIKNKVVSLSSSKKSSLCIWDLNSTLNIKQIPYKTSFIDATERIEMIGTTLFFLSDQLQSINLSQDDLTLIDLKLHPYVLATIHGRLSAMYQKVTKNSLETNKLNFCWDKKDKKTQKQNLWRAFQRIHEAGLTHLNLDNRGIKNIHFHAYPTFLTTPLYHFYIKDGIIKKRDFTRVAPNSKQKIV